MDEKLKKRLSEIDCILDGIPIPVIDPMGTRDTVGLIIDELQGYMGSKNPEPDWKTLRERTRLINRLLNKIGKIQTKCKRAETKNKTATKKTKAAGALPEPERTIEFMGGSLDVIDASKIKPGK